MVVPPAHAAGQSKDSAGKATSSLKPLKFGVEPRGVGGVDVDGGGNRRQRAQAGLDERQRKPHGTYPHTLKNEPLGLREVAELPRRLWHNVTGGTNRGQSHPARSYFSGE